MAEDTSIEGFFAPMLRWALTPLAMHRPSVVVSTGAQSRFSPASSQLVDAPSHCLQSTDDACSQRFARSKRCVKSL